MTQTWLQRILNIYGIASMHWSEITVGLTDMTSLRWQHHVKQHSHQAHWSWQTRSETWCTGWWWRTGEDLSVAESPGARHQVVLSRYFTFFQQLHLTTTCLALKYLHFRQHRDNRGHHAEQHVEADEELVDEASIRFGVEDKEQHDSDKW